MRHEFASCFSLPCSLKADVYNENALKKFAALQNTNLPCILRVYKRKNQTNAFLERKKLPRLQSLKHWFFPLVMQQLDCCFAGAFSLHSAALRHLLPLSFIPSAE